MNGEPNDTEHIQADVGELIAHVRHDLRSPLTAIRGFASLMLSHQDRLSSAQQRQFVEAICQASDQMVRLVDSLQVLLTTEAEGCLINPERVDIPTLIEEALKEWRGKDTSRTFSSVVAGALPPARCDPRYMRLAIDIIIGHTIGELPPGTSILVEPKARASKIAITVRGENRDLEKHEASHPREWDIGMSAFTRIVQAHGGRISEKAGAVTFTLPVWRA